MKISCVQMAPVFASPEDNFTKAEQLFIKAAEDRPDVIVFPELWNTGFFPKDDLAEKADADGADVKKLFGALARRYSINTVAGSSATLRNGKVYNTSFIFDRNGNCNGSYDKIHLFSPMRENEYFVPGNDLCVFETDGVKCGVAICYDIRFPELTRAMSVKGIDILFLPAQWPEKRVSQLEILLKARAVENQIYTVCCNACGKSEDTVFGGSSAVTNPFGNTLIRAGNTEEIISCECDLSVLRDIRENINVFRDRRTDLYKSFFMNGGDTD